MASLNFSPEQETATLWGDLHPPQSDPESTPRQELVRHMYIRALTKNSLADLYDENVLTQRKVCTKCHQVKPLIAFSKGASKRTIHQFGRRHWCKICCAEYTKNRALRLNELPRARHLRAMYGLTLEEYNAMFEAQGGVCKSCGNPETRIDSYTKVVNHLAVDHDHVTGKVRSLLCNGCNAAYGLLREDIQRIEALRAYHYWLHGEDAS